MIIEKLFTFFWIWIVVLAVNQIFLFGGCFTLNCLAAALPHTLLIAGIITFLLGKEDDNKKDTQSGQDTTQSWKTSKKSEGYAPSDNYHRKRKPTPEPGKETRYTNFDGTAKAYGDAYEKYIGLKLEENGYIVIYNGFIKGYEDRGVDIIALSRDKKVINFVQCKNWHRKQIQVEHIVEIYKKIADYQAAPDFTDISVKEILEHLQLKDGISREEIVNVIDAMAANRPVNKYRKTLYCATELVVDLAVGRHLKMIRPDIFRYKNMKIVFEKSG